MSSPFSRFWFLVLWKGNRVLCLEVEARDRHHLLLIQNHCHQRSRHGIERAGLLEKFQMKIHLLFHLLVALYCLHFAQNPVALLHGQQSHTCSGEGLQPWTWWFLASNCAFSNAFATVICPLSYQVSIIWMRVWMILLLHIGKILHPELWWWNRIIRCWVCKVKCLPLRHSFCWFEGKT